MPAWVLAERRDFFGRDGADGGGSSRSILLAEGGTDLRFFAIVSRRDGPGSCSIRKAEGRFEVGSDWWEGLCVGKSQHKFSISTAVHGGDNRH